MPGRTQRPIAYRDLAAATRESLRDGQFADGRAMPTELELADLHGVSRQTVRRAMQELVSEGLIYRVPGRGTFAREMHPYLRHFGSVKDLMGLSQDTELRIIQPLRMREEPELAARLGLSVPMVGALSFVRKHDAKVFCLTTVYLAPKIAELLRDVVALTTQRARTTDTVIGLLDERMAKPITTAEQVITAVLAPPDVQRHLGASAADAVLRVERRYLDEDGVAVELAISHFLPEQYSYRTELHRNA